jgi:uncharacterized Zn-binding protein involved in type VI secretion
MPKAARVNDSGRHDKDDLTAMQGSPDVFINGEAAVRKGDLYQPENHAASQGSATVNINGKPAVRIGDAIAGHATASTGSPDVFIGDDSYGAGSADERPVYKILLTQVPGSSAPAFIYAQYPYKLFHNDVLVQEGFSDDDGYISYEYEPPLKGILRVEMRSGDTQEIEIVPFSPVDERKGVLQRLSAIGYCYTKPDGSHDLSAFEEGNSIASNKLLSGNTDELTSYIKAKMP